MSVAAEPMPGNAVIPSSTNLSDIASQPVSEGDVISNIRGAIDKLGGKKVEKQPETSKLEKTTKLTDDPVTPEKKVETKVEDETQAEPETSTDEVDPNETPEQKEVRNWGEQKKKLKAAEKKLAELQQKAKDAEALRQELEDYRSKYAEVETERNQYNEELYMTRVEKTSEYKKYITEPLSKVEQQAEGLASRNKLDPDALKRALHEDAKGNTTALDEILSELPEREKQRIYGLSDQLITIADRQADIHENSKLAYEASLKKEQERIQQDTQKAIQTREAVIGKIIPKITSEVIDKMPEDKRPDMATLSKEVMSVNEWPEELKVYGGVASVVLPYVLDDNKSLRSEVEQLRAANAKLRGGSPSPSGGRPPSAPAEVEKAPDYRSMKTDDFIKGAVSRVTGGR